MEGISLSNAANWAEIIGAGSIITGLVFGWFQVRMYRAQQRDAVAINLVQTFYSQDLARALTLLQPVPDGIGTTNRKLKVWQQQMRERQNQPSWAEWFEWLGDQAEAAKNSKNPAHIAHRDWKP